MQAIVCIFLLAFSASAYAFEANAIWVKGTPELAELRKLGPERRSEDFSIGYDEDVTVVVTYRSPARDEKKWAKVSYTLGIESPDGAPSNPKENQKEILAGEGGIPDDRVEHWAASHGRTTVRFTERDARGVYVLRVTVRDHVGGEQITCITRVNLE